MTVDCLHRQAAAGVSLSLRARARARASLGAAGGILGVGGSGSTLIGAEQTSRRCFMMELDALYCDVIVQRYEQFTGKKADRGL